MTSLRLLFIFSIPFIFLITVILYLIIVGKLLGLTGEIKDTYNKSIEVNLEKLTKYYIGSRSLLILILVFFLIYNVLTNVDLISMLVDIILAALIIYLSYYCFYTLNNINNFIRIKGIVIETATNTFSSKSPYNRVTTPMMQKYITILTENSEKVRLRTSIDLVSLNDSIEVCYIKKFNIICNIKRLPNNIV